MEKFYFETIKQDSETGARAGILHTPHGDIETPVYMPVGTQATVKGILPRDLKEAESQIILAGITDICTAFAAKKGLASDTVSEFEFTENSYRFFSAFRDISISRCSIK